jgi:hypothetical protein
MASVDDVDDLIEQYHLAYASGRRTHLLRSPHGRIGVMVKPRSFCNFLQGGFAFYRSMKITPSSARSS